MRRSTEEFIAKCNLVHVNAYDYSKVIYTKNSDKIIIICKKHGEFLQIAANHIKGCKCPKCAIDIRSNKRKLSLVEFINKAEQVHGKLYDYSQSIYFGRKKKIYVICRKHGGFFQLAEKHLKGFGCSKCAVKHNASLKRKTNEQFITEVD